MHIINFLVAILLPFISVFSKLAPPESVPVYFFSDEAKFLAGMFFATILFWAGFLRNYVSGRGLTERKYFLVATVVLIFICVSKIIFALPVTWVTSMFAFGLGVLAVPQGQGIGRIGLLFMILTSIIIISFTSFMLIGFAWFDFTGLDYYRYRDYFWS